MKAITIRQPWATLAVSLDRSGKPLKSVETRSWKTSYRGPIAIHAGKIVPDMFFMGMKEPDMDEFFSVGLYGDKSILCLPYGAVIGKVTLVDCVPIEKLYGGSLDTTRERAFGDWEPGRYGWILANPIRFMTPIPARGKQGIWEWDEPVGWMVGKGETVEIGDSGKLI
ncbi:ASCH domain-containing protein [Flintibacter porci]|uniref:ASCH domain-containing protein n=1 Tax=Flintibacter porci TaxID=3342383 RepID=UPI003F8CE40A